MSVSESNNNIRIRTTPLGSDKYVKVNLTQNFDFLEILSLRIGQEQVYRKYCSDYGVIAGRVICNKGVGVPNAKISVFIPISEEDKENSLIRAVYPFESVDDRGFDGIKYNLLTQSPLVDDICHTAVGSFPEKRRILDCEPWCEVYGKYYKFTTSTNASGDYMIFGVPIGVQTVHMDVDLSDIGYLSQKPYDMIRQGSPSESFETYNKFSSSPNISQLPQVRIQNRTINVLPFWGDIDECEIGINRVDFDLGYDIQTNAFFIGSIFGDSEKNSVNKNCRPRKKLGYMNQLITGPGTIEMIRKTPFGGLESFVINGNQNIDEDGTWILQLPMNLEHKVTDEFGNLIDSGSPEVGIATKASYRFRIGMNDYLKGFARVRSRAKFLVPNYGDYTFGDDLQDFTIDGRPNFANLEWNGIYTVKQFIARYSNRDETECKDTNFIGIKDVFESLNNNPFPFNRYDRNTNPLFNFLCFLIIYVLFPVITAVNIIASLINGLGYIFGFDVDCVGPQCNGVTYAPACFLPPSNQNVEAVDINAYSDCFQSILAEAFNIYSFYFTNDWINGTLFAFLFKYKYKKNNGSKFCNADVLSAKKFVKDQICQGGTNPDCVLVYDTRRGAIIETDFELYYAATLDDKYLFATDIYNLGSSKNCDYFGKPKVITEIPTTTFNFLEPIDLSDGVDGDERGIDSLLVTINCIQVKQNPTQCRNTSRVCELNVDPEVGDSEPIDNTSLEDEAREIRADLECLNSGQCSLDILNGDGGFNSDWRNYRKIYLSQNGYLNPSPQFNESNRHLLQRANYINNSFYFYFGLLPGKSAIDKLTSKYFAPCERKEPCPIVINGEIENNKCIGGGTGSITAMPENGTPPYKYNWFKGKYGSTMTPICVDFTFQPSPITLPTPNSSQLCTDTISGLYSDFYTVVVKDNVGQICKKTFIVEDPQPFEIVINYSPYICPDTTDGFIEILPTGGIPPYTIDWTYGADVGTANTGNFFVYNLSETSQCTNTPPIYVPTNTGSTSQFYFANVYDSGGQYGCLSSSGITIDITESCGFTLTASSVGSCSGTSTNGSVTWGVTNGGVPPFTYIIENTSLNYYWSGNSYDYEVTKKGIPGGSCPGIQYTATTIDACGSQDSEIVSVIKSDLIYVGYRASKAGSQPYAWYIFGYIGAVNNYSYTNPSGGIFYVESTLFTVGNWSNPSTYWYQLGTLNGAPLAQIQKQATTGFWVRVERRPFNATLDEIRFYENAPVIGSNIGYPTSNGIVRICKNEIFTFYASYVDISANQQVGQCISIKSVGCNDKKTNCWT
jgi:hypothetical protein